MWDWRAVGVAAVADVHAQELPTGSYSPPVLSTPVLVNPPQMIILAPVLTAMWEARAICAPVVVVVVQVSPAGSYSAPVSVLVGLLPPQTIILEPVQTAVCSRRPAG